MTMSEDRKNTPVVSTGDCIKIKWPDEEGRPSRVRVAVVEDVLPAKKKKHESSFRYKLTFYKEQGDPTCTTRLLHLDWQLKTSKKKKKPRLEEDSFHSAVDNKSSLSAGVPIYKHITTSRYCILNDQSCLQHIVAPMVGASELAFRLLCRRYGATLAYTPMMSSERFSVDAQYRAAEFQSTPADRPVVAHFSANDPQVFLKAAQWVEKDCDAIDLNLGCPQRIAHSGHFGSYLLDPADRPLVLAMVKTLSSQLSIPIFVKIRLLDSVEDSVQLCRQLVEAGAGLIAIHARYRVNLVGRTGPGARDGAAHLDQVCTIRSQLPSSVPIIANGNVVSWSDVASNRRSTGCQGIMSAEGLLDDPALFNGGVTVDRTRLAMEYLELVDLHPTTLKTVVFHVRRMCKEVLQRYQLLEDCLAASSVEEVRGVIQKAIDYDLRGDYEFSAAKAKAAKDALDRRRHEEGKRRAYEERMARKAKREGRPPDYYLQKGIEPPSEDTIQKLKDMSEQEAFCHWKEHFSQHCFAHHMTAGCARDRCCSFLHADSKVAESVAYG